MHKPVLLNEIIELARGFAPRLILDGTFGRGGHARALLDALPDARLVALDQDEAAITHGRGAFAPEIAAGRVQLRHQSFHDLGPMDAPVDLMLLDLGVSSPQLDEAARGFSFYNDGPLDMRMDQRRAVTAADIVNGWSEVELIELFRELGEVRRPQRVVRAVVSDRATEPFSSTRQLAGLIERVEGWRKKGYHPATQYFLALRMAVNDELSGLREALPGLMRALADDGRLMIITFHSLEDRIIKYAFREATDFGYPLFKKVIIPTEDELRENPRARSAKLRVFQRGIKDDQASTKRYSPVR